MDALTLLAVVQELRRALEGARVATVHPAGPHALWLALDTAAGQDSLLVSAEAFSPRLCRGVGHPTRPAHASPLTQAARKVLEGTVLRTVTHHGLDRLVVLEFANTPPESDTAYLLAAELFGRQPNLVLVDRPTGRILEAVRRFRNPEGRSVEPGQPHLPPPEPSRPDPRTLGTVEAIGDALARHLSTGLSPTSALRQGLAGVTEFWAREVEARATEKTATGLARSLLDLIHAIETGPWEPHLVRDEHGRLTAVSPVRLHHVAADRLLPCPSLGKLLEAFTRESSRRYALDTHRAVLRKLLRKLEIRLRSRRGRLAEDSLTFARAETWRRMGDILVAHQGEVRRGATEVVLPDHASGQDATLTLPLDPSLTPAANAERYFKLARRGRRGVMRVASRLAQTEAELARVHAWMERVEGAASPADLNDVSQEMAMTPRLLAPQDRDTLLAQATPSRTRHAGGSKGQPVGPDRPSHGRELRESSPEPRRFVSSEGIPILVGRNTQGNDYLTLHLARSRDLWLHVQGRSGSHVVVQVPDRSGQIPRRTLIEAAQLAAYYSQGRNDSKVAVDYTLRKYVRKPRKAKAGLVTISQEQTILVTPDKSLVEKLATRQAWPGQFTK